MGCGPWGVPRSGPCVRIPFGTASQSSTRERGLGSYGPSKREAAGLIGKRGLGDGGEVTINVLEEIYYLPLSQKFLFIFWRRTLDCGIQQGEGGFKIRWVRYRLALWW